MLAGRDLMAGAQTGTGKTAAFALPILQRLSVACQPSASPARHPVRALVLTPTRELAVQVAESFRDYGKHVPLRSTVVYGGVDMNAQIEQLRKGVEVLVATPGRLLDHVQNKTVMFNQVSRCWCWTRPTACSTWGSCPTSSDHRAPSEERQNLLFSATFPDEIRKLPKTLLRDPAEVAVAARNAAAELVDARAAPGGAQREARTARHSDPDARRSSRCWSSPGPIGANRLAHQLAPRPHPRPTRSTATIAGRSASAALDGLQGGQDFACWSRPTSLRAAWTSRACRR